MRKGPRPAVAVGEECASREGSARVADTETNDAGKNSKASATGKSAWPGLFGGVSDRFEIRHPYENINRRVDPMLFVTNYCNNREYLGTAENW